MNIDHEYKMNVVSRNEGIIYSDENGTYKFDVILHKKEWKLYLPSIYEETNKVGELEDEQEQIIIQIIKNYLESVRWLGIFRRKYTVKVIKNNNHND